MQLSLFEEICSQHLSVRNVETIVRRLLDGEKLLEKKPQTEKTPTAPNAYGALEEQLARFFSTKVQLTCNSKGKGKITIPFTSQEEMERLFSLLEQFKGSQG